MAAWVVRHKRVRLSMAVTRVLEECKAPETDRRGMQAERTPASHKYATLAPLSAFLSLTSAEDGRSLGVDISHISRTEIKFGMRSEVERVSSPFCRERMGLHPGQRFHARGLRSLRLRITRGWNRVAA